MIVAGPAIRRAGESDLPYLTDIERRADELFSEIGRGPFPSAPNTPADLRTAAVVLVGERWSGEPVTGSPPVGYARLDEVDGCAHLEQLSVDPEHQHRGHGTALVRAALDWARERSYPAMTLCTFRDVAWNGPFYARLGFEVVTDPTSGLRALRERERELGLDDAGARVVMRLTF